MRLLLAEDEPDLAGLVADQLSRRGFVVDAVPDGVEAIERLRAGDYDAVILDIMMPRMDGLSVLSYIRSSGDLSTPVLMLTARDSVEDRVLGLDSGADDYLIKPFSMEELITRVNVIIRRHRISSGETNRIGDLTIDLVRRQVTRGGRVIDLTAKEFAILECLCSADGAVVSRESLRAHCWNSEADREGNIVDVYVRFLRKKIDDPFEKKLLHTVRGVGYALREPSAEEEKTLKPLSFF